jgi:hypothetical protein
VLRRSGCPARWVSAGPIQPYLQISATLGRLRLGLRQRNRRPHDGRSVAPGWKVRVLAPDGRGAALYWRPASAQGRTNRANIEQASSGRIDTVVALPSPTEHGPGQSLCPTREAGTILPKHASPSYRERAIFFGLSGMHSESVASSGYAGAGADGRVSGRASRSQRQ